MIAIDDIPLVTFNEADSIRLIATAYIDEPAMAPLVDDESELDLLANLEGLTSARCGLPVQVPPGVDPMELLTERHGYGWSYVNAAFCYTRPTGNRFNDVNRGAWYATWGAGAQHTALAEVSWHLTQEFDAVGVYENVTAYRELLASFATRMHDLRGFADHDIFDRDPEIAYPKAQLLAANLLDAHSNGILYPSVRADGSCLAAFRPNIIQNIRQGSKWTLAWDGEREPSISENL